MSDLDLKELVASLAIAQKETDRQLKETDRQLKETDQQLKETDRQLKTTDQYLKDRFAATDRNLNRLEGLFSNQWGKLVEAMVEPACLRLFKERGIKVEQSMRRVESERLNIEFDVILVNGSELVVVEVKTTCKVEDVKHFLENLNRFREAFPAFKNYTIYGAMAAITYDGQSDRFAHRHGLYVIKNSGETVKIANPLNFKPKTY